VCTYLTESLSRTLYCGLLNLSTSANSQNAALANVAVERYSYFSCACDRDVLHCAMLRNSWQDASTCLSIRHRHIQTATYGEGGWGGRNMLLKTMMTFGQILQQPMAKGNLLSLMTHDCPGPLLHWCSSCSQGWASVCLSKLQIANGVECTLSADKWGLIEYRLQDFKGSSC